MLISELVKQHIRSIFSYCDDVEHGEIEALLNRDYSKRTFGIYYPFCSRVQDIDASQSRRYWTDIYSVRGKQVRVTSQWFEQSKPLFRRYLFEKRIGTRLNLSADEIMKAAVLNKPAIQTPSNQPAQTPSSRANSRYKGNPVGNAQNLFIRNILSSLGTETFSEEDWNATKDYFSRRCVYCGMETELLIEHAIPINKAKLGEHRLGNLVPSCKLCNSNKAGKDYKEFLGDNAAAISRIETYMNSRNYVPLEDNPQMKMILNMAHKEVAALADRYITLINEIFPQVTHTKGNDD